jgi:xanthine/uracil permease
MGGTALKTGGADVPTMMAALFGSLMLASCTEMVISRILPFARRIITPLVSGVVVMIIGLSLIQVGLTSVAVASARWQTIPLARRRTAAGRYRSCHHHPAEPPA